MGKRKSWLGGVSQSAKGTPGHIPTHGGPVTGNGRTGNKARKPQPADVSQRGAGGKVLRSLTEKLWGRR